MKDQSDYDRGFAQEIQDGLQSHPKSLPSKFFYDDRGSRIFQDIMAMPEYYITDCEEEILRKYKGRISKTFRWEGGFDLVELGAGDGLKTRILLKLWYEEGLPFHYYPLDISDHALRDLEASLLKEFPGISVTCKQGTYLETLKRLRTSRQRKIIMMLGSNIGNMKHAAAISFLKELREVMDVQDLLFMGFDQKKDPKVILDAYNDKNGITAAFNKNLLRRINEELDGDFDLSRFMHWATYNPESGTMASFLVSMEEQKVSLNKIGMRFPFRKFESIHTEISQKYDPDTIVRMAAEAGFEVLSYYSDRKDYFRDYVFRLR